MSSDLKYEKLLEEFCKDFRNDSGMTGNECECLRRIERLLTHIKNDNRRKNRSVGRDVREFALSGERKRDGRNSCKNEGGSGGGEKSKRLASRTYSLTPPRPSNEEIESAPDGI